ncbi:ATP-binding protein, partial [Gemmatimonadota bacterium]
IQFICREVFDAFIGQVGEGTEEPSVPMAEITRKLDSDFFAGRWSRVTDRQRELLLTIALLDHPDEEFTVQEIVEMSKEVLEKPFSGSHANQMLVSLTNSGLVYKNRHGKYLFAVPLLGQFIRRQYPEETQVGLGLV